MKKVVAILAGGALLVLLAAALSALHHSGYVAGDLNESNVLVTPAALVTLIAIVAHFLAWQWRPWPSCSCCPSGFYSSPMRSTWSPT